MVNENKLPKNTSRDDIINIINKLNVPCYSGSCSEVYKEIAFENTNLRPTKDLVNAKKLGEISLMFLVHPTLTTDEMQTICQLLTQALNEINNKEHL